MRILGIDPGFAITGYSIIDYIGNRFKLIDSGAVLTKAGSYRNIKITTAEDMEIAAAFLREGIHS